MIGQVRLQYNTVNPNFKDFFDDALLKTPHRIIGALANKKVIDFCVGTKHIVMQTEDYRVWMQGAPDYDYSSTPTSVIFDEEMKEPMLKMDAGWGYSILLTSNFIVNC
jgi:hypothetical protein